MRTVKCPRCGCEFGHENEVDGRAATFRCRLRIYDKDQPEAVADTDPEIVQSDEGTVDLMGFPAIATYILQATAQQHEGEGALWGLNYENVKQHLHNIRSTLSRRKGSATFRLQYDSARTWTDHDDHVPQYLVRVDMVRVLSPKSSQYAN